MPADTVQAPTSVQAPPAMSDVDVFGLTHQGRVRKTNADHFLICSFHRSLRIHATSIGGEIGPSETESRGFLLLVADGVGSLQAAADGSAKALAAVTQHLLHASEICSNMAIEQQQAAIDELKKSVAHAHRELREQAENAGVPSAATTLTMCAVFWPKTFVVHVGDSRMYRLLGKEFQRLTTDQTMAQMMVESGAMSPEVAERSRLKHVLWSAVGSQEVAPEVIVLDSDVHARPLLCSDGLTKHVTDDEIREHLSRDASSEAICRALVDLALERGGSDNITVVTGQIRRNAGTLRPSIP